MKKFASEFTHKFAYAILFILLSLVLFPQVYITIMTYLIFASMGVSLAGYIFDWELLIFIAHCAATLFASTIGLGILGYHWEWMYGRE